MPCCGEAQDNYAYQDAEKVRQPVLFIWSVWLVWSIRSVSCVWLNETNQMDQIDQVTRQNAVSAAWLPTVTPVAWSIVVWAIDVRGVKKWRPVDPGATQVEPESHRGIGVEGRDRLHDSGWLC